MAVAKVEPVWGYDCDFIVKPEQTIQTECPICLHILREPYQVICCGKSFCHSCIEQIKALKKPCPYCNKTNFVDFPNKGHQQLLYQYRVRCTHEKEGCEWTGELGELDRHLNLNPQPANQLKGCVFAMVKCSHCSESCQRQHISDHQSSMCPKRPFTCNYCTDYRSTFEDISNNHWPVCGYVPEKCLNRCGAVLQRRNMERHIAKDCPLTVIECDFHYAGCTEKLPRKEMEEHLQSKLVTHMSMMAVTNNVELKRSHEQIGKLKQRVAELEQERKKDQARIELLQSGMKIVHCQARNGLNIPPVDIIMSNFEEHKKNDSIWYSQPFYTHDRGYKLCLKCYANGEYADTHVSVYFIMIQGNFDNELQNWPFSGEVTIQLLCQDGSTEHLTQVITLQDRNYYSRNWTNTELVGQGKQNFISHEECYKGYVHNDCLWFRISKVKLTCI